MAAEMAAAVGSGMSACCAADMGEREVVEAAEGYVIGDSGRPEEAVA